MLWWGWLAFNAGSTFGITGRKWILAANSACTTIVSSFAGCLFAVFHRGAFINHVDKKLSKTVKYGLVDTMVKKMVKKPSKAIKKCPHCL